MRHVNVSSGKAETHFITAHQTDPYVLDSERARTQNKKFGGDDGPREFRKCTHPESPKKLSLLLITSRSLTAAHHWAV